MLQYIKILKQNKLPIPMDIEESINLVIIFEKTYKN